MCNGAEEDINKKLASIFSLLRFLDTRRYADLQGSYHS